MWLNKAMNVLISHNHGLGDTAQFSIVLKHLRKHRPDWKVFTEIPVGKHTGLRQLCENSFVRGSRPSKLVFDQIIATKWLETAQCYENIPSGKVTRSLLEEFKINPDESLFKYQIDPEREHLNAAQQYVASLPPSKGIVTIHYQGTSSKDKKNIPTEEIGEVCRHLVKNDYMPVILDWDKRSPLPDQRTIFNPDKFHPMWGGTGTGCMATIAALIQRSKLFIGVDSGPLHVAGSTSTPSIGIWVRHHPLHFFELSDVHHLVPSDFGKLIKMKNRAAGEDYFERKYKYSRYVDLREGLLDAVVEKLKTAPYCGNPMNQSGLLRTTAYDRAYYEQHRDAGCDYAHYGDWQKEYGRWIVDCMKWRGKDILEFGCAAGAIAKGLSDNGSRPCGIDLNEYTIKLGRENWSEIPLFVGDGANMHMFHDNRFDGIHSQQVLEHLKPELVPFVLKELNRVCKPGATFFAVLDTKNSFNRQQRTHENEDPTHYCIQPMEWWASMLRLAGWEDCKEAYSKELKNHVCSYLNKYDWDWFVVRKKG